MNALLKFDFMWASLPYVLLPSFIVVCHFVWWSSLVSSLFLIDSGVLLVNTLFSFDLTHAPIFSMLLSITDSSAHSFTLCWASLIQQAHQSLNQSSSWLLSSWKIRKTIKIYHWTKFVNDVIKLTIHAFHRMFIIREIDHGSFHNHPPLWHWYWRELIDQLLMMINPTEVEDVSSLSSFLFHCHIQALIIL